MLSGFVTLAAASLPWPEATPERQLLWVWHAVGGAQTGKEPAEVFSAQVAVRKDHQGLSSSGDTASQKLPVRRSPTHR